MVKSLKFVVIVDKLLINVICHWSGHPFTSILT